MIPAPTQSAKVMLLGDIGVGKTSLAERLVFDRFDADYKSTLGVDVFTHDVDLGPECHGAKLRLVLWDTDGDFGPCILDTVYLTGASAAIGVADATRPTTIVTMTALLARFEEDFPGRATAAIVNKIDLAPHMSRAAVAPQLETIYTSAKTGEGVEQMFVDVGRAVWRRGFESRRIASRRHG